MTPSSVLSISSKTGEKGEARNILEDILRRDKDNARAWAAMFHIAKDREEALSNLHEVLRLKPNNEWALERLAYLTAAQPSGKQQEPTGLTPIGPPNAQPQAHPAAPSDALVAAAQMKSFVGPAVLVFFLYFLFYIPGLVTNFLYLSEAGRVQRLAGRSPTGMGCLQLLLVMNLILPLTMCVLLGGFGTVMAFLTALVGQ